MEKKRIVALVALVVLVAAGIAFFALSGEPTAADIGQNMEESYDEVNDYEGEMTVQVRQTRERDQVVNDTAIRRQAQALAAENESLTVEQAEERIRGSLPEEGRVEILNHTTVAEVTFSKPDRYRYEYVQQPPGGGIGAVVTEGNLATIYREGYEPEERELGSGDEPLVGLRMGDYVPTITDDYELSVNRSTEDTYVLDLTPVTEFEGALDRVHVDRETNLPVRVERSEESAGSTTHTVVEYDYEYDVGVDESAFEVNADGIDYPENEGDLVNASEAPAQQIRENISETAREQGLWEVENVTRESFEFDTIEEGEDWLGTSVPRADLESLSGYEVVSVRGNTVNNNSSLTVTYRNNTATFSVYVTPERESRFADWPGEENEIFTVEQRQVAGKTAELHYYRIEGGYGRSVVKYDCDGLRVEVYADTDSLSHEGVLDAAENVGC
jgi:outer membrane lipoprotein-sorting protein